MTERLFDLAPADAVGPWLDLIVLPPPMEAT